MSTTQTNDEKTTTKPVPMCTMKFPGVEEPFSYFGKRAMSERSDTAMFWEVLGEPEVAKSWAAQLNAELEEAEAKTSFGCQFKSKQIKEGKGEAKGQALVEERTAIKMLDTDAAQLWRFLDDTRKLIKKHPHSLKVPVEVGAKFKDYLEHKRQKLANKAAKASQSK